MVLIVNLRVATDMDLISDADHSKYGFQCPYNVTDFGSEC